MFSGVLRRHARLSAAVLSAPLAGWALNARAEQRVYVSGEALGRGIRLELWKAKHENVVVLDFESELIQLGMTRVRDRENEGARFVHDANAVIRSSIDLALTELPNDEEAVVTTPQGYKTEGVVFEDGVKVCGITLSTNVEVQKSMARILQAALPYDSPIGEVLIEETLKGDYKLAKAALPSDLDGYEVVLLVPNFNAIERVNKIMHLLRQEGVEEAKITVVTLVTCPEAADSFCQTFGDARLVTASFDARRDSSGFIVPGMGDFDARYLGAASPELDPSEVKFDDNDDDKDGDEGIVKKLTSLWPFK